MRTADVSVRPMRNGDGELVHRFHINAVTEAPLFMGGSADAVETVDTFDFLIDVMTHLVPDRMAGFIAEVHGTPAGMILAVPELGDDGSIGPMHLYAVWVEPWARGAGAGRALVETAIDWASVNGWNPVELWVATENHTARQLYASCGFETTPDHRPLMGHPEIPEVRLVRHGIQREGIAL